MMPYPPGGTPAQPAPAPRFVKRGFYMCCVTCGLAEGYCPGHREADQGANDGASSDLSRRIAEARMKAGAR